MRLKTIHVVWTARVYLFMSNLWWYVLRKLGGFKAVMDDDALKTSGHGFTAITHTSSAAPV